MTEEAESRSPRVRALKVSRAWQRLMLVEETGEIRPDGKVVLKDLMNAAQFFDRQYELGNHDRTLELAVKRQIVVHIFAHLNIDAASMQKAIDLQKEQTND